jgi:hypothetical protein
MKRLPQLLVGCVLVFSVACGKKDGGAGSSGEKSFLAKHEGNLAGLLTRERLESLVDLGGQEPQQEVRNDGPLPTVAWSWPSDRVSTLDVGGQKMEFPDSNQLGIAEFRLLDKAAHGEKDGKTYVERNYRAISAEEMAAMQERMQQALEKRVADGEITAEQARLAGGLGGSLAGKERLVEEIEGVGDACRWVAADSSLVVGHRNVFLRIHSKISADSSLNRDKAVELARLILAEGE